MYRRHGRFFNVFIIGSSKDERSQLVDNFHQKRRKWNLDYGPEIKIHLICGLADMESRLAEYIPRMVFVRDDTPESELAQIKEKIYARHPQLSVSFFGVKLAQPAAVEQPAI